MSTQQQNRKETTCVSITRTFVVYLQIIQIEFGHFRFFVGHQDAQFFLFGGDFLRVLDRRVAFHPLALKISDVVFDDGQIAPFERLATTPGFDGFPQIPVCFVPAHHDVATGVFDDEHGAMGAFFT